MKNMHQIFCSSASLVALMSGAFLLPTTAQAQSTGSSAGLMQEIIVTAQRREQNLQDVGISIAAYSGDLLRESGVDSSTEIARMTPGLHLSGSAGGQNSQFSIRGVTQNEIVDTIEGPVAVYVDEGYIPNLQGQTFGTFDIERVEVLKGPQGTLFGRNATGGLVHFVVNKPTEDFDGYVDATYGRFNQTKIEAAFGGPISDKLSARISGYWNRYDEIWKNIYPAGMQGGSPTGAGAPLSECCEDVGNDDTMAGRFQLQLKPSDQLTIRATGSVARQNLSESPYTSRATIAEVDDQGRVINGFYVSPTETRTAFGPGGANYTNFNGAPPSRLPGADWFGFIAPDPENLELSKDAGLSDINRTRSYNAALHINYDFENVTLTSISDYKRLSKYLLMDVDATPVNLVNVAFKARTESISQELRLSGTSDRLNWVVGGYFLRIDTDAKDGFLAPPRSFFAASLGFLDDGIDLINVFGLKTTSYSGYGQVEYEIVPKFTFVLGGRIISERQNYYFSSSAYANERDHYIDSNTEFFTLQPSYANKRKKTLWAGKAQIEFRPNDDLLLYVGVNRGVKGGSYNAKLPDGSAALAEEDVPYGAETLMSYEGGFKSTMFDGRAQLSASAYYYDYSNYQAFTFSNVSGFVQNRDARTYGIEADLQVSVTDSLLLSGGASLFDAKVKNVQIAPDLFRDVKPAFAPETQLIGRVSYRLPADVAGGAITVSGDVSYSSSFYHNIRNFDSNKLSGYTLFNARASWKSESQNLRLTVFLDNITDKRYATIGYDLSTLCGCSEETFGKPRWWGISAGYTF